MWQVFIHLMIFTEQIVNVPSLYNKGIPLYYLVAPALYMYTRVKLGEAIPKHWLIHLIPFILGLIDIMPYVFVDYAEKVSFLLRLVENPRLGYQHGYGFVPQQVHYICRLSLALVYLVVQWRMLFLVDRMAFDPPLPRQISLYVLNMLYTLFIAFQMGIVFNIFFNQVQAGYILLDASQLIWLGTFFFLLSLWSFFGVFTSKKRP